jgi:hypothetical protein
MEGETPPSGTPQTPTPSLVYLVGVVLGSCVICVGCVVCGRRRRVPDDASESVTENPLRIGVTPSAAAHSTAASSAYSSPHDFKWTANPLGAWRLPNAAEVDDGRAAWHAAALRAYGVRVELPLGTAALARSRRELMVGAGSGASPLILPHLRLSRRTPGKL